MIVEYSACPILLKNSLTSNGKKCCSRAAEEGQGPKHPGLAASEDFQVQEKPSVKALCVIWFPFIFFYYCKINVRVCCQTNRT